ncbi:AAA family ATPase [Pseudothermotoga sp. U03pept]|uniref:AAA family ATPase n=1 Tax=Pseudothermotoga sp. U03pept TaxID=3447012 RepID=UPI003F0D17CD
MVIRFAGRNLLYFDEFEFDLSDGLNVITGETGAGKSILLRALQALFGRKVDLPVSDDSYIEALVSLPQERLSQFDIGEDQIVVSLSLGRRWIYRLNGRMITQGMVEAIFEDLVHFHQQNSQTGLLKPKNQLAFLDVFQNDQDLFQEYQETYKRLKELEKLMTDFDVEETQKQLEDLQTQIDYFQKIDPSQEEETLLRERYQRILKQQQIAEIVSKINLVMENDSPNGFVSLWDVLHSVEKIASVFPAGFLELLKEIIEKSEELNRMAKSILQETEIEDAKEIEERIWAYNDLKRRYGPEIKDVIEHFENIKRKARELEEKLKEFSRAKEKMVQLKARAFSLAEKIHENRLRAADQISREVKKHLKDLAMKIEFFVKIDKLSDLTSNGIDEVEFSVSLPNGERLPVRGILSGGELSRLLLSLELVCASKFSSQILVFDEVDAGIGGMVGNILGRKLKEVSENFQTIVVTHLPQIAVQADRHFVVERANDRMVLRCLTNEERKSELLRMVGGEEIFGR